MVFRARFSFICSCTTIDYKTAIGAYEFGFCHKNPLLATKLKSSNGIVIF